MSDVVTPMGFSDEELTELALAADPDAPLDPGATPWQAGEGALGLLPDWYMPAPSPRRRRLTGWRRTVVITLVVAFVLIDAAGLCSTYGSIVLA